MTIWGLVQDVFHLESKNGTTARAYCIQHAHALLRAQLQLQGDIPKLIPSELDTCVLCDARAAAPAPALERAP